MSRAATDWRRPTRRQIAWTLLIKLAALIALWALFFSPQHRVQLTPDAVQQRLLSDTPTLPGD